VALDAYGLQYLNLKAEDIPFLKMGEERGIGVRDWKSLDYIELSI